MISLLARPQDHLFQIKRQWILQRNLRKKIRVIRMSTQKQMTVKSLTEIGAFGRDLCVKGLYLDTVDHSAFSAKQVIEHGGGGVSRVSSTEDLRGLFAWGRLI